jgi:ceramide glucosyltransferase
VLLKWLDPEGMVSKVVALRSEALGAVGGFASLETILGEDMELARRLRAKGFRAVVHDRVATSRASGRAWSAVIDRYARWITVIRAQRPALMASYPAMFFATGLVAFGGACVACSPASTPLSRGLGVTAGALAIAARVAVAIAGRRAAGHALAKAPLDAVLADAVLACAFVKALGARTVLWRGRVMRVARGGVMSEVECVRAEAR